MKQHHNLALTSCLIFGCLSVASATQVAVSPFTDNLSINLKNFPAANFSYKNDNDVNITGPENTYGGNRTIEITIFSANRFDAGYPQLSWKATDSSKCTIIFVDGPWVDPLSFKDFTPPSCKQYTVSTITKDAQYHYSMDITYTG